jgi:hypothetical protein
MAHGTTLADDENKYGWRQPYRLNLGPQTPYLWLDETQSVQEVIQNLRCHCPD